MAVYDAFYLQDKILMVAYSNFHSLNCFLYSDTPELYRTMEIQENKGVNKIKQKNVKIFVEERTFNPFSTYFTKWSNILKTICRQFGNKLFECV